MKKKTELENPSKEEIMSGVLQSFIEFRLKETDSYTVGKELAIIYPALELALTDE